MRKRRVGRRKTRRKSTAVTSYLHWRNQSGRWPRTPSPLVPGRSGGGTGAALALILKLRHQWSLHHPEPITSLSHFLLYVLFCDGHRSHVFLKSCSFTMIIVIIFLNVFSIWQQLVSSTLAPPPPEYTAHDSLALIIFLFFTLIIHSILIN